MNKEKIKDKYIHHKNLLGYGAFEMGTVFSSIWTTNALADWYSIPHNYMVFLFVGLLAIQWLCGRLLFGSKLVSKNMQWSTKNNPDFDKIFECFWMVYEKVKRLEEEKIDGSK